MLIKILAAATLILLGIVVFSTCSGSNNESTQDDKEDIIQKIEVNNSNFFEVSEDWNDFKVVVVDNEFIPKIDLLFGPCILNNQSSSRS